MTTNSWTAGGGIANFATASDWSLGHTPTSTEDAVVSTGASGLLLGATSSENVNSISLGKNDILLIDSGSFFAAVNGTGPNFNNGTINLNDADLVIGNTSATSSFDNSSTGSIVLNGTGSSATAVVFINGSVNLTGSGSIEMTIGDPVADNVITGDFLDSSTPNLTNKTEDISGSGTIGGDLNFTNDATVETNNNTSSSGGTLVIQGSAGGGGFTNASSGIVQVDDGGTLVLGVSGESSSIVNNGTIQVLGNTNKTFLDIAGTVTLSGTGQLSVAGNFADNDFVEATGGSATLVNDETITGNGEWGDKGGLTIDNNGVFAAAGQYFMYFFPTHAVNHGTLEANAGGAFSIANGTIDNTGGTIAAGPHGYIGMAFETISGGTITVGQGAEFLLDGVTITGAMQFVGGNAEVIFEEPSSSQSNHVDGGFVGANATDVFIVNYVAYSSAVQAVWQQQGDSGTLSLVDGGTTLFQTTLVGHYSSTGFTAQSFGGGVETEITLSNPIAPPPLDFNGNGSSDALWRNSSDDSLVTWLMNGSAIASSAYVTQGGSKVTPDSTWSVMGVGDFNGDGDADVLWRQSTTGSLVTWLMNGSTVASSAFTSLGGSAVTLDSSWSVVGVGDFNGDGDADVMWRQSTTGSLVSWQMNGSAISSSTFVTSGGSAVTPDSTWSVVGVGDFNGDGDADVLWRQSTTGSLVTWLMNGSAISSSAYVNSGGSTVAPDSTWSVVGVGDFNGDGDADVLWRQSTTGSLAMWLMNGSTITSSALVTSGGSAVAPDSTWNIVEVGDFNGTNQAGVLWQQSTTGTLAEWLMNGAQIASAQTVTSGGSPVAPASAWQLQGNPTDFA